MRKRLIVALAACGWLVSGAALASQALATQAGCTACHTPAKKLLGPSYSEIAAKYKGRADAAALLTESVRKGSKGKWGALPMTPTGADRINDADLKALISWVLKTP